MQSFSAKELAFIERILSRPPLQGTSPIELQALLSVMRGRAARSESAIGGDVGNILKMAGLKMTTPKTLCPRLVAASILRYEGSPTSPDPKYALAGEAANLFQTKAPATSAAGSGGGESGVIMGTPHVNSAFDEPRDEIQRKPAIIKADGVPVSDNETIGADEEGKGRGRGSTKGRGRGRGREATRTEPPSDNANGCFGPVFTQTDLISALHGTSMDPPRTSTGVDVVSVGTSAGERFAEPPSREEVRAYFSSSVVSISGTLPTGHALRAEGPETAAWPSSALLGWTESGAQASPAEITPDTTPDEGVPLWLNVHEPFALAAVGVQGSGKSHTLATVLEACLLPLEEVVRLTRPLSALVLHYDMVEASVCESVGLASPSRGLRGLPVLPRERMVVLVSPTYFHQRARFYGPSVDVRPLLFDWQSLTADHLKRIMRVSDGDTQPLYIFSLLTLLRRYQRSAQRPSWAVFVEEVKKLCSVQGQGAPLDQRLALLSSLVRGSADNVDIAARSASLPDVAAAGTLVIVDMTDPLLSAVEANGVFQVLVEQYRALPLFHTGGGAAGKLLALDEAHRYMDGSSTDGLSASIVNAARLMRHDGLRLAVSSQSPKTLAPELLELISVCVLHRFHSPDWLKYLSAKLPLPPTLGGPIAALTPGRALVFAAAPIFAKSPPTNLVRLRIRPRITGDHGISRTNVAVQQSESQATRGCSDGSDGSAETRSVDASICGLGSAASFSSVTGGNRGAALEMSTGLMRSTQEPNAEAAPSALAELGEQPTPVAAANATPLAPATAVCPTLAPLTASVSAEQQAASPPPAGAQAQPAPESANYRSVPRAEMVLLFSASAETTEQPRVTTEPFSHSAAVVLPTLWDP